MVDVFKVETEKFPFDHALKVTLHGEEISISHLVDVANMMAEKLANHGEFLQIVKDEPKNEIRSSGNTRK